MLKAASHSLALVDNVRAAYFNARWLHLALDVGERTRCATALFTETVYQKLARWSRRESRARMLVETVAEARPRLGGFRGCARSC